jgi:hypothetical protein
LVGLGTAYAMLDTQSRIPRNEIEVVPENTDSFLKTLWEAQSSLDITQGSRTLELFLTTTQEQVASEITVAEIFRFQRRVVEFQRSIAIAESSQNYQQELSELAQNLELLPIARRTGNGGSVNFNCFRIPRAQGYGWAADIELSPRFDTLGVVYVTLRWSSGRTSTLLSGFNPLQRRIRIRDVSPLEETFVVLSGSAVGFWRTYAIPPFGVDCPTRDGSEQFI